MKLIGYVIVIESHLVLFPAKIGAESTGSDVHTRETELAGKNV